MSRGVGEQQSFEEMVEFAASRVGSSSSGIRGATEMASVRPMVF